VIGIDIGGVGIRHQDDAEIAGTPDVDLTAGIADGGSVIVSPGSEIIGGPLPPGTEGIVYADMDLDLWVRNKLLQDFAGHYNRPDVFNLEVNRTPSGYEVPKTVGLAPS
jgi:aliphatic nitrilase